MKTDVDRLRAALEAAKKQINQWRDEQAENGWAPLDASMRFTVNNIDHALAVTAPKQDA